MILLILVTAYASGQTAFAKAEQLFKDQKYDLAETAFSELYQQNAKDLKSLERLGDIQYEEKNYEKATEYYKILLERNPKSANANFKYGGALGLLAKNSSKFKAVGMLDDVKQYLKNAASIDPKHIECRHALSQLYCELPGIVGGSMSKSRMYADELLHISPVDGHIAHGFIHEYEKDYDKAVTSYKKAIKTGGSLISYRKLAAVYEYKLKQNNMALEVLQQAQKIFNDPQLSKDILALKKRL